jgi:prevent-host-death family protein
MAEVTAFEAKTRFGKILERVSRGEEIVITRHDRPVARIIPEGRASIDHIRATARQIEQLRERIGRRRASTAPLSDAGVRELIDEGRR